MLTYDGAVWQALKASSLFDKVKSALPFGSLPVFELAEAEAYQSPPQENQNADFGPNEVTKDSIGDISLDANNPFDTAAPGELQPPAPPVFERISLPHPLYYKGQEAS